MFLCFYTFLRQFSTLVENKVAFYSISFNVTYSKEMNVSSEKEAALRKDRSTLTYLQVHLCEVGLSSHPVNLKLLIVSGKQVVDMIHLTTCWGHTVSFLPCLFNNIKWFIHKWFIRNDLIES